MPDELIIIIVLVIIFILLIVALYKLEWLKTKINFFKLIDFEFEGKRNQIDRGPIKRKKQKELPNLPNLKITNPVETYIEYSKEYVPVSGIGAIPDHSIILISSLDGKYLAPQEGRATIEANGNWEHSGVYLKHGGRKRYIYALSISKENETEVRTFLENKEREGFHSDRAIEHLINFLNNKDILFQISQELILIRKNISDNNSSDVSSNIRSSNEDILYKSERLKELIKEGEIVLSNYSGSS